MKPRATSLLFVAIAAIALVVHWLLFEMRYMWYVSYADFWVLRAGYVACAAAIIACWAFLPSRLLVAIAGVIGLLFPHVLFSSDARPVSGRELDVPTIVGVMLGVVLLVVATELRRRMIAANKG